MGILLNEFLVEMFPEKKFARMLDHARVLERYNSSLLRYSRPQYFERVLCKYLLAKSLLYDSPMLPDEKRTGVDKGQPMTRGSLLETVSQFH
ncbi:unnamed protein product [Nezara viridula]|uniref:Uncharacterized protein n=1 Tax=Nezara viridula TaxID=85310 RepID=A0A9P0HUD7_NEZVI|nr:unnamed protein product [Nezara viridula]